MRYAATSLHLALALGLVTSACGRLRSGSRDHLQDEAGGGEADAVAKGAVSAGSVVAVAMPVAAGPDLVGPPAGAAAAADLTDAVECGVVAGNAPAVRPLSHAQYRASVQQLLGVSGEVASALPPEASGDGFDTTLGAHVVTATATQAFLDAGVQLATDYVAAKAVECSPGFDQSCVAQALVSLAQKAYRRPLLAAEKQGYLALPATLIQGGSSAQEAYATGVAAILMAPQFLYRTQLDAKAGLNHSEQYALAAALSYTLWNTQPDDALLGLAKQDQLNSPAAITAEIQRLLDDPRSAALAQSFGSQWLGLSRLDQAPAAATLAKTLVQGFKDETNGFFAEFLRRNLNVKNLLDAPFSYLTPAVAQQYDVVKPAGDQAVRVDLKGEGRGGLLTQGAFLVQAADADATSPVKRGKWILDTLLCAPPPPRPDNVQVVPATPATMNLSMRERLAQHRASAACAGCHVKMDPLGLALENYDKDATWRERDNSGVIDPSGTVAGLGAFTGPGSLAQLVKNDPEFPRCLATKLAVYSLGRQPEAKEACLIKKLAGKTKDEGYGLKSLLLDLSLALLAH